MYTSAITQVQRYNHGAGRDSRNDDAGRDIREFDGNRFEIEMRAVARPRIGKLVEAWNSVFGLFNSFGVIETKLPLPS